MNATDLIQLLREHPKACAALGIVFKEAGHVVAHLECTLDDFPSTQYVGKRNYRFDCFRRWLTGAATEWFDEENRPTYPHKRDSSNRWTSWSHGVMLVNGIFPSRLHALLAAIEAHEA